MVESFAIMEGRGEEPRPLRGQDRSLDLSGARSRTQISPELNLLPGAIVFLKDGSQCEGNDESQEGSLLQTDQPTQVQVPTQVHYQLGGNQRYRYTTSWVETSDALKKGLNE